MGSEDRKNDKVAVSYVKQIACSSAMECFGVVGIANIPGPDGLVHLLTNEELTKGVKVSLTPNKKIHIEVYVILEFGIKIEAVAENLIDTIKYNVENKTGLKVGKVTVNVQSVRV